ncbi:MAG: hypothetical protein GY792_22260 [Gammaproteobacteria bacterium]|nr:hypothetical protein [Gammaproteobacteria bacterium]
MIEKSESNQLSLATAPILGQAPRSLSENNEPTVEKLDLARFPDNFR